MANNVRAILHHSSYLKGQIASLIQLRIRGKKSEKNTMGEKAYTKGSKFPAIANPGQIRLYGMRFCPYVKRVRLVLADSKIQYDVVNINLTEKPEWYVQRFPEAKVPAIELNGKFLFESLIIADFLDDLAPGHKLHPTDPLQKAVDRCLVSKFNTVTDNWGRAVHYPNAVKESLEAMGPTLIFLEEELGKRGTSFFGGNKPKMLDLMIWPWFEMMLCSQEYLGQEYPCDYILPSASYKYLQGWMKSMMLYPSIKQLLNVEHMIGFARSLRTNKRDYDFGLP